MCNETTSFRCPTGHSGCFKAFPQVSRRPERQDQVSKGPSWCRQEPPGRYDIPEPCCTSDSVTTNHSGHTHCHYRLSIQIDNPTLFINSWLIRLSVDKVLLINIRNLSIVIDKSIPLSIGISSLGGYIVNLCVFYSYMLIGELTDVLHLQEFSLRNLPVDSSTSITRRYPHRSNQM